MKKLSEYRENIHSCSKCGLCQSVCPIYKITGNDCTVSRGHFIMLKGIIDGKLRMSRIVNRYLDLCLKCGACSKFCPSAIDVVEIIALAKSEYFKQHSFEKVISVFQKIFVFGIVPNIAKLFSRRIKSQKFDKKVIYFGGCGGRLNGNRAVVKILNACGIEVITPDFDCCGIPFYVRGDMDAFLECEKKFTSILNKYDVKEIVTTCASCEKTLKSYSSVKDLNLKVRNIYEYIRENNADLSLKKNQKVTFHKPCNINNFDDIERILKNTKNLEYVEMNEYDKCCGLNGISKLSEYKIMFNIFWKKYKNIRKTGAKIVLTSCLGCEYALKLFSFGKYKVMDFAEFLAKNI